VHALTRKGASKRVSFKMQVRSFSYFSMENEAGPRERARDAERRRLRRGRGRKLQSHMIDS